MAPLRSGVAALVVLLTSGEKQMIIEESSMLQTKLIRSSDLASSTDSQRSRPRDRGPPENTEAIVPFVLGAMGMPCPGTSTPILDLSTCEHAVAYLQDSIVDPYGPATLGTAGQVFADGGAFLTMSGDTQVRGCGFSFIRHMQFGDIHFNEDLELPLAADGWREICATTTNPTNQTNQTNQRNQRNQEPEQPENSEAIVPFVPFALGAMGMPCPGTFTPILHLSTCEHAVAYLQDSIVRADPYGPATLGTAGQVFADGGAFLTMSGDTQVRGCGFSFIRHMQFGDIHFNEDLELPLAADGWREICASSTFGA